MPSEEARQRVDKWMREVQAQLPESEQEEPTGKAPAWAGPDYHPTDEAIAAFAEPAALIRENAKPVTPETPS
jgi:hypothetical protein